MSINGVEKVQVNSTSFHVKGKSFIIDDWTNVIIDYQEYPGVPNLYPETNWFLRLGTPTKKLRNIYSYDIHCTRVFESNPLPTKSNISSIDNTLKKIMQINGVTYYLGADVFEGLPDEIIQEYTKKKQIGFIAQDLEKIYPSLVYTEKKTGEKSVNYTRMIKL